MKKIIKNIKTKLVNKFYEKQIENLTYGLRLVQQHRAWETDVFSATDFYKIFNYAAMIFAPDRAVDGIEFNLIREFHAAEQRYKNTLEYTVFTRHPGELIGNGGETFDQIQDLIKKYTYVDQLNIIIKEITDYTVITYK
jgi:predicted RNA-binding protein Jag